jgi:hypothetical protein
MRQREKSAPQKGDVKMYGESASGFNGTPWKLQNNQAPGGTAGQADDITWDDQLAPSRR